MGWDTGEWKHTSETIDSASWSPKEKLFLPDTELPRSKPSEFSAAYNSVWGISFDSIYIFCRCFQWLIWAWSRRGLDLGGVCPIGSELQHREKTWQRLCSGSDRGSLVCWVRSEWELKAPVRWRWWRIRSSPKPKTSSASFSCNGKNFQWSTPSDGSW